MNEAKGEMSAKEERFKELEEEEKRLKQIEQKVEVGKMNLLSKQKDLKQALAVLGVAHLHELKHDLSSNEQKMQEIDRIDKLVGEKRRKVEEKESSLDSLRIEKCRLQGQLI